MLPRSRYPSVTRPVLARLAPALLALASTLLLGMIELPFAQRWHWLESPALLPVIGIVFAGAVGLFACHLAALSAAPRRGPATAALPAAMIAGALPGLGTAALLVPLALSAHAAIRTPALRVSALIGLAGTAIALTALGVHSPALHVAGALTLLAGAALRIGRLGHAANDNRRDEPFTVFWSLPADPPRAKPTARTSSPVLGE